MSKDVIKSFREAISCGVPFIAIRTPDQLQMINRIGMALQKTKIKIWQWDKISGIVPLVTGERRGESWPKGEGDNFTDAPTALDEAKRMPPESIMIMLGGNRILEDPVSALAMLKLRDRFKENRRTLVILGFEMNPVSEIRFDILVLTDPLPTEADRLKIVDNLYTARNDGLKEGDDRYLPLSDKEKKTCARYMRGLPPFAAEQTGALSMLGNKLEEASLEEVWRSMVDMTPGLSVLRDLPNKEEIAGLEAARAMVTDRATGREPPEAIVFVDEIEKHLAGSSGVAMDSSGASQAILGATLSHMEDTGAEGMITIGPPGTGKTRFAQVSGKILSIPVINLNLGNLKGSLVGETEANAAMCFATLKALAGRQYWVVTCNSLGVMPPELLRRFTDGVWFFDLPSKEERKAIWKVHLSSYKLKDSAWNDDDGWTGADIRNVVRKAWRLNKKISEIAPTHVPSSLASSSIIERLRAAADGVFFSASYPGVYRRNAEEEAKPMGRRFSDRG